MKIGFFGDSYCDLLYKFKETPRYFKPWSRRLIEDNKLTCVNSGRRGSNQFYAIDQWHKFIAKNEPLDFALFTFTWHDRLYSNDDVRQTIMSASAERREIDACIEEINAWHGVPAGYPERVKDAIQMYYECLYSNNEAQFNYDSQIDYILALPDQYQDIKFIFVPNTEYSRDLACKNFTHGLLLDFAFETLSNFETGSPGIMPIDCDRIGHLNDKNHDLLAQEFIHIIKNYEKYQNQIIKIDYNKFDIQSTIC